MNVYQSKRHTATKQRLLHRKNAHNLHTGQSKQPNNKYINFEIKTPYRAKEMQHRAKWKNDTTTTKQNKLVTLLLTAYQINKANK